MYVGSRVRLFSAYPPTVTFFVSEYTSLSWSECNENSPFTHSANPHPCIFFALKKCGSWPLSSAKSKNVTLFQSVAWDLFRYWGCSLHIIRLPNFVHGSRSHQYMNSSALLGPYGPVQPCGLQHLSKFPVVMQLHFSFVLTIVNKHVLSMSETTMTLKQLFSILGYQGQFFGKQGILTDKEWSGWQQYWPIIISWRKKDRSGGHVGLGPRGCCGFRKFPWKPSRVDTFQAFICVQMTWRSHEDADSGSLSLGGASESILLISSWMVLMLLGCMLLFE